MSYVYATTETGERFLVRIECDGCDASTRPHPEINKSGWTKTGWDNGLGTDKCEGVWCPNCSGQREP